MGPVQPLAFLLIVPGGVLSAGHRPGSCRCIGNPGKKKLFRPTRRPPRFLQLPTRFSSFSATKGRSTEL